MMVSHFRSHVGRAVTGSLAVLVTLFCATSAGAQQADLTLLSLTPITVPLPPPSVVTAPSTVVTPAPAFWALIGGYEGDSNGSGYGFFGPGYVRPIRPGLSWTARASASFLAYQFSDLSGTTHVRSPGVNAAIGLQFGDKNYFKLLAGPEVKWRRSEVTPANGAIAARTDTRLGANVGGEVSANPTSHNNFQGLINYSTSDRYTWGRLGFKEQMNNHAWQGATTVFLGVEGIVQGNSDIRSTQLGGFFEIARVPARVSIVFKAGYKRSTFNAGPDKSGPYFAVGFYQRLK